MIIKFKKHDKDKVKDSTVWYLHDPTWRGDIEDLKLPVSLNGLIEEETGISTRDVQFEVSRFHMDDAKILDKVHNEEMENGRYDSYYGEVYICELLLLFFPTGYPNKIYYKVISND